MDKTGTITSGEPKVTDILPAEGYTEEELLKKAYALEKKSEHPLARAILTLAEEQEAFRIRKSTDFQAVPGNGLTGSLNGKKLAGGNLSFISRESTVSGQLSENRQQPFQRKVRLRFSLQRTATSWVSSLWQM